MRPTSTYPSALDFLPEAAGNGVGRRTLLATAKIVLEALGDGLVAAHDYERLRTRGLAPEEASRRVLADHFKSR